jgi:flavin reductase (DIM6/NTAB) family NADH-FMN oxidoreductase RutF
MTAPGSAPVRQPREKVGIPTDKRFWRPSPLIGQVSLVTTLNEDGGSNVAPKSLISMMGFDPPVLALGCILDHWTARNIIRSGESVVNLPGDDLAEAVWRAHELPHPRPVEAAGLTPIPAEKVKPPRIEECRAHLECVLDRSIPYGMEVVFLLRVVAASLDAAALKAEDPYQYLRPFAFLEDRLFGVVERARRLAGD